MWDFWFQSYGRFKKNIFRQQILIHFLPIFGPKNNHFWQVFIYVVSVDEILIRIRIFAHLHIREYAHNPHESRISVTAWPSLIFTHPNTFLPTENSF